MSHFQIPSHWGLELQYLNLGLMVHNNIQSIAFWHWYSKFISFSQAKYFHSIWTGPKVLTHSRINSKVKFSTVKSLSHVRLLATPWLAALQASLSITNSPSSLKLTSIESVMPSSHLILCHPLFLLPPIPPSIRIFSSKCDSTYLISQPLSHNPPSTQLMLIC